MKVTLQINIIIMMLLAASFSSKAQTTLYVNSSAGGNNDGSSWTDAYISLQSALDVASSEDEIWVAKGTYKPSSAYDLTNTSRFYHFRMKNGVSIYGGFAGTETAVSQRTNFGDGEINETLLNGDIGVIDDNTDNCYHIFYHPSGINATAVLDGFTISDANADGGNPHWGGAGMNNYNSSPTVSNVIFKSNSSVKPGAGMSNISSSPVINNCSFISNSNDSNGGGVYNQTSSPVITNTLFSFNTAYQGGGVYSSHSSTPVLTNCLFISNTANGNGGGIFNTGASHTITNSTFTLNSASLGGGMYNSSSTTINNCIVWGNSATTSGKQIFVNSGTTTLNYSCYSNGTGDISGTLDAVNNNITTDPQFVDPGNGDFRILGSSPSADAGDNSYNSETYDIRGEGFPRKLNKTDGTAGTIDMGAYEYQFANDPLPVEIISFSGSFSGAEVELIWETATEINNYGFDVQQSLGNSQQSEWETVGFVQGNGTTNSPKEYSFTDILNLDLNPNLTRIDYRLKQIDNDGTFAYSKTVTVDLTQITSVDDEIVYEFALGQNYPNPFNPTTSIEYSMPSKDYVSLKIYDILGNEVKTLVNEQKEAGKYRVNFNASNLSSAIYFFQITAGKFTAVRKMMLIK